MIESFANLLLQTEIHDWIISVGWVWAVAEILHFIGLSLLLGSMLLADLALMGLFPGIRASDIKRVFNLAVVGFLCNACTGAIFVIGEPLRYFTNVAFHFKMLLIIFVGINVLYFNFLLRRQDSDQISGSRFKLIGIISFISWLLVVICGRLIPYVE